MVDPALRADPYALYEEVRAGGDLAIIGDPGLARPMADAAVDEARTDDDLADDIEAATIRVLQLKDRRGLADC